MRGQGELRRGRSGARDGGGCGKVGRKRLHGVVVGRVQETMQGHLTDVSGCSKINGVHITWSVKK